MSRRTLPLQWLTALSIVAMMLVLAAVLLWHGARGADQLLVGAVRDTGRQLAVTTEERARRLIDPARVVVQLLARDDLVTDRRLDERLADLPLLAAALDAHTVASAVYIGYDDGDFLLLRPMSARLARVWPEEMPHLDRAAYLAQVVLHQKGEPSRKEWRLYDERMTLMARRDMPDYVFDPRTRPWYRRALAGDSERLTDPYVFFTSREIGVTLSRRSRNGKAVVGLDASLVDLGHEMPSLKLTPGTHLAVISPTGKLLAHSEIAHMIVNAPEGPRLSTLEELGDPVLSRLGAIGKIDDTVSFREAGEDWLGMLLPFQALGAERAQLLVAVPEAELLAETRRQLWERTQVAGALVLLLLPLGIWAGHRIGRPLRSLAEQVRALAAFDFAAYRGVRSPVREVERLGSALEGMAGSVADFQRLTRTLSAEPRLESMLDGVLEDLLRITGSRHGAIYLEDEADTTRFTCQAERQRDGDGPSLPERLALETSDEEGMRALSRDLEARGYLVQPLRNRGGHRLGLLLLARRGEAENGEDRPWRRFVEEISGAAAVAIETRRLLEGEKRLLDAIVELIAGATDAKSPHTGGHCSRVPQLAEMLLDSAHQAGDGPFAAEVVDDDRRTAFHLAAWLHDCGKLTTPDEVMEKATKLETRYDRIHEVRTRFEVLWRDADIAYWQGLAEGGDEAALAEARARRRDELQEAFGLLAEINRGTQVLDDERAQRLETIAEWRWWRHFDDRLGVSDDEAARLAREPETPLPAEEPLLADRPRHQIEWLAKPPPVAADDPANRWGFDMRPPEVAGHRGELYNLRVRRGTLNEVERFRVQEHIVQTIVMLESLPWPTHLRRVPEIAGNHHERMDGRGYPRGLSLVGASLEERIMALADIFEALTAADRPYKPGMPVSRALSILADMARGGHLDPEVFALLLDSEVWRLYAERFLRPEQQDEVDIAALKAAAGIDGERR